MRVVFDTNIFVSFLLTSGDTISRIVDSWKDNTFQLLVNEEILVEIKQVLNRFVISGLIGKSEYEQLMRRIENGAKLVPGLSVVDKSKDKKDNRYLACAKDGEADYLVTGDKKHLLPLGKFGKTKIISPKKFVDILK